MPVRRSGVNLLQMVQKLLLPARGLVIAERLVFARSAAGRIRGLIGTESFQAGTGLVLKTRQVHTFGMRYAIDVVFCSGDWRVLHVVRDMPPRRISRVVIRARYVVELPAKAARPIDVGDRLVVSEAKGS